MAELLPHTTAALNAASALLLVAGWWAIRRGRREQHRRLMLGAFGCSALFLLAYLARVALTGVHRYPGAGREREFYLALLASHTLLAAVVPLLAVWVLTLALRGRFEVHRRWARVALPIWLCVSVTGVAVYWMLYHHAGVGRLPAAHP